MVTLTCRDVCAEGFGLEDVADAGNYSADLTELLVMYNVFQCF